MVGQLHQYNRRQKHKMYFTNSRLDLIRKNNFVSSFDDKSMFDHIIINIKITRTR